MKRDRNSLFSVVPEKRAPKRAWDRIYQVVRMVPPRKVATYGQIAAIVECTPRQVGYAMAMLESGTTVPWQRIINRQGRISIRSDGHPDAEQRFRLHQEGVVFDNRGVIDLAIYGWPGPSWDWLLEHSLQPATKVR